MRQVCIQIEGVALFHATTVVAAAEGVINFSYQNNEKFLAVMLKQFALLVAGAVFDQKGIHFAVGLFEGERDIADAILSGLVAVD